MVIYLGKVKDKQEYKKLSCDFKIWALYNLSIFYNTEHINKISDYIKKEFNYKIPLFYILKNIILSSKLNYTSDGNCSVYIADKYKKLAHLITYGNLEIKGDPILINSLSVCRKGD